MNQQTTKQLLVGLGFLTLVGAVGAQTYYTHQLSERLAAQNPQQQQTREVASTSQPQPDAPYDPWAAMQADMQRWEAQMDRMIHSSFFQDPGFVDIPEPDQQASITLDEKGDTYVVKATIPGAKEGDIDVHLDGRNLSISAQQTNREEEKDANGKVIRQDSYASSFQQYFSLPGPVDASTMKSEFDNGVLTLTIPKATS